MADADDVAALRDAGVLVLRCSDPDGVRVLSTESVVADGFTFRALLDMYQQMPGGYSDNDKNRVRFANALVKYAAAAMTTPTPEGQGDE
jgi:hypothetical protein